MRIISPIVDILVPALEVINFLLDPIFDTFKGISGLLTLNGESLSTMETIMGSLGILALTYLGVTKSIALYEGIIVMRKANAKFLDEISLYLETSKKRGILSTIGALTLQLGIKMGILSAELASNAALTFGIGVAIAVAAAAAGYATIKALTADDMVSSPSGYGKRTLMGPEGAIALNNKDTVIAGTKLFGDDVKSEPDKVIEMFEKGDNNINPPLPIQSFEGDNSINPPSNTSSPSSSPQNNSLIIAEIRALRTSLESRPINVNTTVELDGEKIGSSKNVIRGLGNSSTELGTELSTNSSNLQ